MHVRLSARSFGMIRRMLREVYVGKSKLVGERLRDLAFGREVQADEDNPEPLTGAPVLHQRGLKVGFGDEPRLDETFTDFLPHLLIAPRGSAPDLLSSQELQPVGIRTPTKRSP